MPATAPVRAWLDAGAERHPDKMLVRSVDQGTAITYGEAHAVARRMARMLAAAGCSAGDRVALLAGNSLEHLLVYYGVMYYGATVCTVHVEMNEAIVGELVRVLGPKLVLYEEGLGLDGELGGLDCDVRPLGRWHRAGAPAGIFADLARVPDGPVPGPVNAAADIAAIFYTSGTTSTPKGVPCTFRDLARNVVAVTEAFGIDETDTILDYRSFNWMSAQTLSALGALSQGATLVVARKFSRSRFFDWIAEYGVTVAAGNPTVINMLSEAPVAVDRSTVPTLRFVTSSSAPLQIRDWTAFEDRYGIPIVQGYGSSETGWIAASSESVRRLGSVGRTLAYQKLAIVDGETGRPLPAGEVGFVELGAGADAEFRYLAADGSVAAHARGRYRTGDLGYLDADGFLYLTGRESDLIIRGGVNISPAEIDTVLNQVAGVAEAASVGVPDAIYGEEVVAFVVAQPDAALDEAAVLAACRGRLALPKMPKRVVFCEALPKTARGKLDRKALAARWADISGQAAE